MMHSEILIFGRRLYLGSLFSLFFQLTLLGNQQISKPNNNFPRFSKESNEKVSKKLVHLDHMIEVDVNTRVRHFIESYLERGRKSTEIILGRSSIYFPVIEKYLELYNLPDELKYLAVVESALNPKTVSNVGAAGIWQFMPTTAKLYGLRINKYVDERLDLHRSTDAALRYLAQLHSRYGDWSLALAAYNCGPGRVDKELRKVKNPSYKKIKKRLPKQTQRYIEKFIAVNYALGNYLFYELRPAYPDYNLQMTTIQKIYGRQSFKQIAASTGISMKVIYRLNPSFLLNVIPSSTKGYYLILPQIGNS